MDATRGTLTLRFGPSSLSLLRLCSIVVRTGLLSRALSWDLTHGLCCPHADVFMAVGEAPLSWVGRTEGTSFVLPWSKGGEALRAVVAPHGAPRSVLFVN